MLYFGALPPRADDEPLPRRGPRGFPPKFPRPPEPGPGAPRPCPPPRPPPLPPAVPLPTGAGGSRRPPLGFFSSMFISWFPILIGWKER